MTDPVFEITKGAAFDAAHRLPDGGPQGSPNTRLHGHSFRVEATIRGVAKPALSDFHIEVIGIEKGFRGLVENHSRVLHPHDVEPNETKLDRISLSFDIVLTSRPERGPGLHEFLMPPPMQWLRCLRADDR